MLLLEFKIITKEQLTLNTVISVYSFFEGRATVIAPLSYKVSVSIMFEGYIQYADPTLCSLVDIDYDINPRIEERRVYIFVGEYSPPSTTPTDN